MKKILFCFLMFYAFSVNALEAEVIYQNDIYSNRIDSNNKIHSGLLGYIFIDGEIAYCLDPYKIISNDYELNSNYKLKQEDLDYFSLVAYYGYNNANRNNIYYYMAAQSLIWERIIGNNNVFWTTKQYNDGEKINIDQYKKEIIDDINNFYLKPSFANKKEKIEYFSTANLYDKNHVIDNYIAKQDNVSIANNYLKITMDKLDFNEANIYKNINNGKQTKIYTGSGQTLATFGINLTNKTSVFLEPNKYRTRVYLQFHDSETNEIIRDIKFDTCDLDIKWFYTSKGYTSFDWIYEGTYNICNIDEYEDTSFTVSKDEFGENTFIDVNLKRKDKDMYSKDKEFIDNDINLDDSKIIDNVEETSTANLITELKKDEIIEEKTNDDLQKENLDIDVLPNTYDYNLYKYLLCIITIIGSISYKIKNK